MYSKRFHETWVLPLLVLLFCSFYTTAQCPLTTSASYPMLEQGLPTLDKIELIDFLVNQEDSAQYHDVELSQILFACHDIGIQEINITGLDSIGQAFSCNEFLWVYDSVYLCSNRISTPKVAGGKIFTELGQPLNNVTVGLSANNINYFRGTNESGLFLFENYQTADYRIIPSKTDGVRNGISTIDILYLQKHVLGLRRLGSPYKIIAADVNNSGDISAFDMVLLRQLILSVIDEFPNTPSWRFVDANYVFSDELKPFVDDFPEFSQLDRLNTQPKLDNRFIAIKVGDFNNSVNLSPDAGDRARVVDDAIYFDINNHDFGSGDIIPFTFKASKDMFIEGIQFALGYDENILEFVGLESEFSINENNYFISNGVLNFSWTIPEGQEIRITETPFKILFRAKENGRLKEVIQFENQRLKAEIYVGNDAVLPLGINWKKSIEDAGFQVFSNYPNPFYSTTFIPFYLPQSSEVKLSIYSISGQLISVQKEIFDIGKNRLEITNLPAASIYFYKLESDFGVANGKMNYFSK